MLEHRNANIEALEGHVAEEEVMFSWETPDRSPEVDE
jgi:hypothetical protein